MRADGHDASSDNRIGIVKRVKHALCGVVEVFGDLEIDLDTGIGYHRVPDILVLQSAYIQTYGEPYCRGESHQKCTEDKDPLGSGRHTLARGTVTPRHIGLRSVAVGLGDTHQRLFYVVMHQTTPLETALDVSAVPADDPRASAAAQELHDRAPRGSTSVPNSEGLRLLAVHAHPDDESSKGAAMMAAYADAGAEVMVATVTGGEAGSLLNPAAAEIQQCHRDLTGVRRQEMAEAAEALGVQHVWLGFVDSGLPEGDPPPPLPFGSYAALPLELASAPLVRLIRRFQPHVVTCYDESGGYPHPDHIMSHKTTVEAYHAAGDASKYPDCGQPWQPQKLYYDRAFNPGRFRALHEALVAAGINSPFGERLARWESDERPDWLTNHEVTTQVPVGEFLEARDAALKAHRTQVDPEGFFFATPNDFLREVWPYDDFVLAHSRVETSLPENDLFSGLRGNP